MISRPSSRSLKPGTGFWTPPMIGTTRPGVGRVHRVARVEADPADRVRRDVVERGVAQGEVVVDVEDGDLEGLERRGQGGEFGRIRQVGLVLDELAGDRKS